MFGCPKTGKGTDPVLKALECSAVDIMAQRGCWK